MLTLRIGAVVTSLVFTLFACQDETQDGAAPPASGTVEAAEGADGTDPESKEETTESARSHQFQLPIEVTLKPAAEIEKAPSGQEIFEGVLSRMGYEKFRALGTIGFKRGSIHWRGGRFTAYDSFYVKAATTFPLKARATFTSNYDEHDRLIPFHAVVNGDDRFEINKLEVLATEAHEEDATDTVAQELGVVLMPFYLAQANATATYVGKATMKTHDPAKYDEDHGCSAYSPVTHEYEVIEFATPGPLSRVFGPKVELYVGNDGTLKAMKCRNTKRVVYYGQNAQLYYEFAETAEFAGIEVPTVIRAHYDFDAYRLETVMVSEVEPNVKLTDRDLRRP